MNWVLVVFLFWGGCLWGALHDVPLESEYVILIDGRSGRTLLEKNADMPCFSASTCKIATVLYALIKRPADLDTRITASQEALGCVSAQEKEKNNYGKYPSYVLEFGGSHAGIKRGEVMTFREFLYAAMLVSGNDACNVIAEFVGNGSIPAFMQELNQFLQELGCSKTHFCNPHGLPHPKHVTCARDMARLAQCALCHPLFAEIVKTARYERPATNKQPKTWYVQTNKLLINGPFYYPYAVGVKTGYTSKAGCNLIAAAEKDGRLLIAAVMKGPSKPVVVTESKALFEAAFAEQKQEKWLVAAGATPFTRCYAGGNEELTTHLSEPLTCCYYPSTPPEVRSELIWHHVSLPIRKGQCVGEVRLLMDGVVVKTLPLFAGNEVHETVLARGMRVAAAWGEIALQYLPIWAGLGVGLLGFACIRRARARR